jgi:hypothetical protein
MFCASHVLLAFSEALSLQQCIDLPSFCIQKQTGHDSNPYFFDIYRYGLKASVKCSSIWYLGHTITSLHYRLIVRMEIRLQWLVYRISEKPWDLIGIWLSKLFSTPKEKAFLNQEWTIQSDLESWFVTFDIGFIGHRKNYSMKLFILFVILN